MKILGFIRVGDKSACGGTVVEGDETAFSHGLAAAARGRERARRRRHRVGLYPFLVPFAVALGLPRLNLPPTGTCP